MLLGTTSIAVLGLLLITTKPTRATDWNGNNSTDWFTAGNWSAGVPTGLDSAAIDTVTPNATVVGAAGAVANGVVVGSSGTGMLAIQNSGTLGSGPGTIGNNGGSIGTATVTGAGSSWTVPSILVGQAGTGTLIIEHGGAMNVIAGGAGIIGSGSGGIGTVMVDGAGSTWTNSGILVVGLRGTGALTIQNGGTLSSGDGRIGFLAGSIGTVTVTGAGSSWTGASALVGNAGTGTLTIQNGAAVSASSMTIANLVGSVGTLNIGAASGQASAAPGTLNASSVAFGLGTGLIVFNHTASNYTFAPTISGAGAVTVEAGTTTLTTTNTYTGATTVTGGTLIVDGSISSSSGLTVDAGATVRGTGTLPTAVINGTLAPGNSLGTMTVQGNLAFQSGAVYLVQVNPSTASLANVSGTAALAGNVLVNFAPGNYVQKQYDILHAAGLSSTFAGVGSANAPGFALSLSYTNTDVFLNLTAGLGASGGLNVNQQRVANAINGFFNNGGSLPPGFGTLFGLAGANLSAALSQASGEVATGTQQTTFNAMGLFMGLLTDPFIAGRGDPVSKDSSGTSAYTSQDEPRSGAERDAYAAIYRKAPVMADAFAQRWSVWTAGYGGSQTTDGNATLGSNNTTSSIFGVAVGADYRLSPDTLAGFALAGGGTNFSIANGLGSGRSDLFQAGAYVRHTVGAAYISGALAYGWQDITTSRTVTVSGIDQLRAQFNANAFSGRAEGGYRFVTPWMGGIGITPYAAGQFTTFDLPAYAEQAITGANTFALAYGAKSVTDTRSELGLRTDKSYAMQDGILTLRGRVAWAHDFNPDRNIGATFQTLPGASFVVNGAAQASDSALVTASVEKKWLNGWSAAATFEGEFSNVTTSYAGKGVVRYTW